MKISGAALFALPAFLIVLLAGNSGAYADPGGGGSTAVSVADAVHAAAQVASLSQEFDQVMADFESATSDDARGELLKKAKNILSQLVAQANNVESEISILLEKKLDEVYARKLDRVLSGVLQMKAAAENKMRRAGQTG